MKDASADNDSASVPPAYEDVTKSRTDKTTLGEVLARRRAARIKQFIDDHIIPAIWDKCSDGISQIVISLDLLVDASVGSAVRASTQLDMETIQARHILLHDEDGFWTQDVVIALLEEDLNKEIARSFNHAALTGADSTVWEPKRYNLASAVDSIIRRTSTPLWNIPHKIVTVERRSALTRMVNAFGLFENQRITSLIVKIDLGY